ncbi:phosphate acyltransferase PlsX [Acidaminococcus fermentans]|uniref:Phosphate acyltransferase n=2 Tax=Acidaminococcus fermentans TaxID=905 RepID=D2RL03_ACIFV|nr:phosphate acyltransferase PlsX [Acidaminococcus fermentans]ADB47755.1 fatty acid/phospholipid synthesis protein PlsX [Acidaminococcus fermentans DSM 20731]MCF0138557.1 phosphate acyltransferase PlsX [Acidaminococcus fermentans]MCI7195657.1 phosphate acyltransferase PlsX [Acidaminococcus fermentans]MDD6286891.1 phosphate acyltransferase PlsX [Acidaminococcus fermentans]MDY4146840.1 phosphate acyltransferase PlsX [Acidaminococcus fermentans]
MKIAVDVMGTDYGPAEIIKGVLQAVSEYGCDVVLVGDQEVIRRELAREHQENNPRVTIHHASQVIEMQDHPGISVKKKKDASIVVATHLLHEKECDALVSSGSTGAAVASALFGLGRIRGIERPAIATVIPNVKGATVLVDSGAKVDAKPEQLVQNAIMGSIYAELQLGIPQPRVGLLNIGEEETKGNEQCLATYPLLKKDPHIHFIGNVEGRDINKGTVDVVVCDGFVGNVVLKTMEGLAAAVMEILKKTLMESGLFAKLGALLMKPALLRMKKQMDASEYGGALLMGVRAPFIICHGSSKAKAIKNAVRVAIELTQKDVVGRIRQEIMHDEESGEL